VRLFYNLDQIIHSLCERIIYDSSLILGFTTGRTLLVSKGLLSGFEVQWNESFPEPAFRRGRGPVRRERAQRAG
jgi:hypothetical protein